jgi:hypothetical protein
MSFDAEAPLSAARAASEALSIPLATSATLSADPEIHYRILSFLTFRQPQQRVPDLSLILLAVLSDNCCEAPRQAS